jgi:hypothetical protein
MIINKKFITPLKLKRKELLPCTIYSQQFISSFFFDSDNCDIIAFLMRNAFRIYLNVWREKDKFIEYLKKFKDEFKNAFDYYQQLLITTKQQIYEKTHGHACFFTFDNDIREILTVYVNELFCNYIDDMSA